MVKKAKKKPAVKPKKPELTKKEIEQQIVTLKAQGYDCGVIIEQHHIGIRQQQAKLGQINLRMDKLDDKLNLQENSK